MKISDAGLSRGVLALALSLVGTEASASHNIRCELEAKVIEVGCLAQLNGAVRIFRVPQGRNKNRCVETVTLQVTRVGKEHGCARLPVGSKRTLAVPRRQMGHFRKGQRLVLSYHNEGDVMVSHISWRVKKKVRAPRTPPGSH
jgi:hypothetical protein